MASSGADHDTTMMIMARLDRIDARLDLVDAKIDASNARAENAISGRRMLDSTILRPVMKYTPGHPTPFPPPPFLFYHPDLGTTGPRELFRFDQDEYAVGTLPPPGLVPDTLLGVMSLQHDGLYKIHCNTRKEAIYWFYNDPCLAIENKTLFEWCSALERFLTHQ